LLKLIKCEFWKLKRRKFVLFTMLFSCVFPLLLSFALPRMNTDGTYGSTKALLYDTLMYHRNPFRNFIFYGKG